MKFNSVVLRSTNGTYHRSVEGMPPECNARSMSAGIAESAVVEQASEEMFCKKCFCNDKFDSRKAQALSMVSA